jgi:hypothetical protein
MHQKVQEITNSPNKYGQQIDSFYNQDGPTEFKESSGQGNLGNQSISELQALQDNISDLKIKQVAQ